LDISFEISGGGVTRSRPEGALLIARRAQPVLESVRMAETLGAWAGDGGTWTALTFLASVGVAGLLERVQYRLRADEGRAWWASNGRDVLNAVALGSVSAGLWVYGFRGPLVVCVAGTLVLLLSMSQMRLESRPRSALWSVAVALALGMPVLVAPGMVARLFERLVLALGP
jgi:hypothetical protein